MFASREKNQTQHEADVAWCVTVVRDPNAALGRRLEALDFLKGQGAKLPEPRRESLAAYEGLLLRELEDMAPGRVRHGGVDYWAEDGRIRRALPGLL